MEPIQSLQRSVLWCAMASANIPLHLVQAARNFVLAGKLPPPALRPQILKFLSTGLKVSAGWEALRDISALCATLINQLEHVDAAVAPALRLETTWREAA